MLNARVPPGLDVHVTVICNACSDDSTTSVRRLQAAFPRRVSLVEERRRGKSRALNAGVAATWGDLIGMIDDDEEVDSRWVEVAAEAFADPTVDFIGGPYLPIWEAPPPDWLPDDYLAVLGAGVQAMTHLDAMRSVRALRRVRVWSRNPERAATFAVRATKRFELHVEAVPSAREAVTGDVVINDEVR